jgi:hypothetical protein
VSDLPPSSATVSVVTESRGARDGAFGFLALAFLAAIVRGEIGAHTTAGRIAIGAILGAVEVLLLFAWLRLVRKPDHIEVSDDAVRYVTANGTATHVFDRSAGAELSMVSRPAGRTNIVELHQSGSSTVMPLRLFTRKSIVSTCETHGWRVT